MLDIEKATMVQLLEETQRLAVDQEAIRARRKMIADEMARRRLQGERDDNSVVVEGQVLDVKVR